MEPETFRFVYNGERLHSDSWPGEHDMEDDDVVLSFVEQEGGIIYMAS